MLRVKVFVNLKEIDEIDIQRVDGHEKTEPIGIYIIRKPEGFEQKLIHHEKDRGYMPLLIDAMTIIYGEREGI